MSLTSDKIKFWIKNYILFIIIGLSLLASLFYSFYYKIKPVVDAQAYDNIAVNLLDGYGFRENKTKSFEFDTAIVRAGPAYEFFLAGIYKVFGHHYESVWIFQALLHALGAWFLYLASKKIFKEYGKQIGILAAALFGLHPDLIEISAMLMTETLYLFLITLIIWLFVELYQDPTKKFISISLGFVLGLAILSRPPVLLFVPIILFFYVWHRHFKEGVIFLLFLILAVTPWVIRNYIIFHQFILTTLIGEYNLWVGNTLLANGGQISGGFNPVTTYTEVNGFSGLKQQASREFWVFIIAHPLVFIKLCILRFIRYFSLIRPMGFWFYQNGWPQLIFVVSSGIAIVILFLSGLSGIVLALKEKNKLLCYLVTFTAMAPLVLISTVVESRYRFQIYPFLALLGGYFIFSSYRYQKLFFLWDVIQVIVVLLILSLVDGYLFWGSVIDHMKVLF